MFSKQSDLVTTDASCGGRRLRSAGLASWTSWDMKFQPAKISENEPSCLGGSLDHTGDMAEQRRILHHHLQDGLSSTVCKRVSRSEVKYGAAGCGRESGGLCNGAVSAGSESVVSHCIKSDLDVADGVREISEVCADDNDHDEDEDDDDLTLELQQAYKIFHSFLLEKHKAITAPFWRPVGPDDQRGQAPGNDMCFKKIDDKFVNREYESITDFVGDFRLMLENCYRFHGVDHWISKQAQKLEIILEQKLTLLSRTLREKTSLAVTSRGRFGTEDERGPAGTSSRRRSVPRSLAAITVGGCESIMVQALRLEEQRKAKEDKRQRELVKKEAEEASAKDLEEWEESLLSLAEPWPVATMWELPAVGHFLCLAQTALNLPEIVFFELERCLLMPRCSSFLAKVMTSLLCQPHRRATLHRRPALAYRRWEAELRRRVQGWFQAVGRAEDQAACAERLGLCRRFFWTLGETSPLEDTAFHLLPFNRRVWLLKGLCDHVYETQKDVQDAVLGQPIHECRESILGYDGQDNAYIHFPHFCGADLRIYCQSPCAPLAYPLPMLRVRKLEAGAKGSADLAGCLGLKEENGDIGGVGLYSWADKSNSPGATDISDESPPEQDVPDRLLFPYKEELPSPESVKEEFIEVEQRVKLKAPDEQVGEEESEPCLRVGGDCYRGKSPANSLSTDPLAASLPSNTSAARHDGPPTHQDWGPCPARSPGCGETPEGRRFKAAAGRTRSPAPPPAVAARPPSRKKKRKKKRERSTAVGAGKLGMKKRRRVRAARNSLRKAATSVKKKEKKKRKLGKKFDLKKPGEKIVKDLPQHPVEPAFKLVCTSLEELRDLISKTEDDLDELESTRKRCSRWFSKREAVKDLHITLIRLLNELSPWEPKLVKAFQRNRARLKKESDDFKKHPEYENFIREERAGPDGDAGTCREASSSADISRECSRGDPVASDCENHLEKESLGGLVNGTEIITTRSGSGPLTRSSKRRQIGVPDENLSPTKKVKMVFNDSVTLESPTEVKSKDAAGTNSESTDRISVASAPIGAFHGRCKPIQALLAKSVGNKVTLISHPQAAAMAGALTLPGKKASAAVAVTKPALSCQPAPDSTQTQAPTPQSSQKSPVQVVYKMPEGFSLVKKDGTPVKFSVQPVVDQATGEKVMQQVIILPSNVLVQNAEDKGSVQPSSTTPVSIPKTAMLLSSTAGITVPANKIPVQQVAPLKDTSVVTSSPAVSPVEQKRTSCRASSALIKTTDPSSALHRCPTPPSSSSESIKCDAKQELRTVCIRDSQSILVTTRGGNTGVVKVQTSGQSGDSVLPTSPVYTIPPHFQAFLVSKSSAMTTSTAHAKHTTTTATPLLSSVNKGTSFKSAALTPLRCVNPVIPSPLGQGTSSTGTLSNDSSASVVPIAGSVAKSPQTLVPVKSLTPIPFQSNTNVPSIVTAVQGDPQTSPFKNVSRSTQKSPQVCGLVPDPPTFQKVFVVTPTANLSVSASSITTASSPPTSTASRVMFMSQSASACSTVTILKGTMASESSMTATITSEARETRPNLGQVTGSTTLTKVPDINTMGLTATILDKAAVRNKKIVPPPEAAVKVASVTVSNAPDASSGFVFVQNSKPTANRCMPLNIKGPAKVVGSTYDKTVTFSTYGAGHMASSALLSAVQQKSLSLTTIASTSNVPNNRLERVVGSSTPSAGPTLGTIINKDTTILRSLTAGTATCLGTTLSPVIPPVITSMPGISHPVTLSTTIATRTASLTSRPVMTSMVSPPVNSNTATTTMQEKFVISTTTPLAPGTQLLINNTRFVVPAQGLGPGSHVLLVSSPALRQAGGQGTSPVLPVHRSPGGPAPPVASGVPGTLTVEHGGQTTGQHTSIGLQAPTHTLPQPPVSTTKIGPPGHVHKSLTAVRAPLVSTDSTALARVTQLGTVLPSGQQNPTSILRLPSILAPEGNITHGGVSCPPKIITVTSQSQRGSSSMATQAHIQTGFVTTPPKPQLPSIVPPVNPVNPRTSPVVSMPPMSSTVSRLQTLPVATVPPIGGTVNSSLTTAVAPVPLSVNTVIMAPCQSVRAVQPGNIRMPVVMTSPSQVHSKGVVHVPGAQSTHTSSKLLLSPDGAILNVLRSSTLQSLPVVANSVTAQLVVPTSDSVTGPVLNTLDSQRIITSDRNAEEPNN
ncbi:putative bromodomain-containing protein 10 isoform X2 [Brachyhypopomus gauderio]|uniref:putative bromodomain-containing protein 10 isoform X2 n=1 Tax=Brachyhypopomus gauderio TaxID=698409 RepID=UPI004041CED4